MNDLLWQDSPFNIVVRSKYGMNDLLCQAPNTFTTANFLSMKAS